MWVSVHANLRLPRPSLTTKAHIDQITADVSSRPYLLLQNRHIEQLSARNTGIAADTAVL
jgi:hypothetical protein